MKMRWTNCIKEQCDESIKGMCGCGRLGYYDDPQPFPTNGKCYSPFEMNIVDIDPEYLKLGAYEEMKEDKSAMRIEIASQNISSHVVANDIGKLIEDWIAENHEGVSIDIKQEQIFYS